MKILITIVLFIVLPYILRILLKNGITHNRFAVITSLLYATLFFLLSIMFAKNNSIVIGVILFLCIMIGGLPTSYMVYPILHKNVNPE